MLSLLTKQQRRHELSKIKEAIEIMPGDSVLVIGRDGKLKKLIMPELNTTSPHTPGSEKVLEILKMFDPTASLETFENNDRKLN